MKEKATIAYQLKVTLMGSKPPIWRRILVTDNLSLNNLHDIIQDSMGWHDCHLHQFFIDDESFRLPDADIDFYVDPMFDERNNLLKNLIPWEGMKLYYQYDFGDCWDHVILAEKILPLKKDEIYPRCIKGKRACPPEDCGSVWGYEELIKIMKSPKHKDYDEMSEWLDQMDFLPFKPEHFDIELANHKLLDRKEIITRI